jgi:hypothetical protein
MSTDADPRGTEPAGVSAFLALVIGFVGFAALCILGLGMLSYFRDIDILSIPGLDWWPAIVAMIFAIAAFCWMLWPTLSRGRPSFLAVPAVALVTAVAHLVALWLAALLSGVGMVSALAAISQLVTRGSSLVVLVSAAVGAWVAIALRRTRAGAPRWPWEDDVAE